QRQSGPIALVFEELQKHNGHLTEADAAALLGISTSWFRHNFKRAARMSFRDARLKAKLMYGAHLLAHTRLSIVEIAGLLQYSDRTKFEKAFKGSYMVTPTVYRRLHTMLLPHEGIGSGDRH